MPSINNIKVQDIESNTSFEYTNEEKMPKLICCQGRVLEVEWNDNSLVNGNTQVTNKLFYT